MEATSPPSLLAPDWPVLVTGASGFVGGHVARALGRAGYRVRGLSRRPPAPEPGDPELEWFTGDLRSPADRVRALDGMAGVVHCAGWVSLGSDRHGEGRIVNVDCTRALLAEARAAGVERFVYTSTLWTVAAGSASAPADESTQWNLDRVRGPYCDTKREAERLVLEADRPGFRTCALCPGLVLGSRDPQLTSTSVLLITAATPVAILPRGGLPVVDARVLAHAHVRALERAEWGTRYVVAGPYVSYHALAREIRKLTGWPLRIVTVPDRLEGLLTWWAGWIDRLSMGVVRHAAPATVAGGFLRLHVSGARADRAFGLHHPPLAHSVFDALQAARRRGRAPWLRLQPPPDYEPGHAEVCLNASLNN
ncbi:MAG TPA: NAD-dependent epimerase/dehydratase family protein [Isosphaeraceae bacterium]|nr:NAD-dependent epimerase/dehydratase family protein [Isosphaeraceae bacterium]